MSQGEHDSEPAVDLELLKGRVGSVIQGKWTLKKLLGAGGMAAVYAAEHEIGRREALKILHPEVARSKDVLARFRREARAANRFSHPGAVEIRDVQVTEEGEPFLVMELLEGQSLARRLAKDKRLEAEEVIRIAEEVLDVLAAAHAAGVIHRDIKPSNLFLEPDGTIKVVDFGVARLAQGETTLVTEAGTTLGTVAYMPPEQLRSSVVDHRADLYALGATMFRALTGRRTHEADNESELSRLILTKPARPLSDLLDDADEGLAQVVARALAPLPDRRYPDAHTMQSDVRALRRGEPPPFAELRLEAGDDPHSLEDLDEVEIPSSLDPPGDAAVSETPSGSRESEPPGGEAEDTTVDHEGATERLAVVDGTDPMAVASEEPEEGDDAPTRRRPAGVAATQIDDGDSVSEGQAPEGQAPEGQAPEGQAPEGQAPEGQAPEGERPKEQVLATGSEREVEGRKLSPLLWVALALAAALAIFLYRGEDDPPPPAEVEAPPGDEEDRAALLAPEPGAGGQLADAGGRLDDEGGGPASPAPPPTTRPTGGTTARPGGLPTSLPTGIPTSLPSGWPTAVPTNMPTTLPTSLPTAWPTAAPAPKPPPPPASPPPPPPVKGE